MKYMIKAFQKILISGKKLGGHLILWPPLSKSWGGRDPPDPPINDAHDYSSPRAAADIDQLKVLLVYMSSPEGC